jgi:1-deoxy-D-xylulose-5-phosphate reductoisomerase
LFPVEKSEIDILVHPQSVVHSMVDYVDGSVLAQLGTPDMRTPIAYALAWPNRMEAPAPKLLLEDIRTLTFEPPDAVRFPALRLAREALQAGNSAPTVLNAANEVAVERFLNKEIAYLDIAKIIDQTLEGLDNKAISNLDDIAEVDLTARAFARSCK